MQANILDAKKPDYKQWTAREKWTPAEAACLLIEKNPSAFIKHNGICEEIKNDNEAKNLLNLIRTWRGDTHWLSFEGTPYFYIEKSLKHRISVPPELMEEIEISSQMAIQDDKEGFLNQYPTLGKKYNFFENSDQKTFCGVGFKDFPPLLKTAIETYVESWHEIPDNMRKPTLKEIISILTGKKKITKSQAEAIYKIIRPKTWKPGPGTGEIPFKMKSERK